MAEKNTPSEYLVISRGQWDKDVSPEQIQSAIDNFYLWHDRLVGEGKMKAVNDSRPRERESQRTG